jgi:hypothetical protein
MNPIKLSPLRKIAEHQLATHFGDLGVAVRGELATSLVRQWLTNDGHAGFVTPTHQCWFRLVAREGGGFEVGVSKSEAGWGRALSEDWLVDEEEVPVLLHRLNLCQSVLWRNADGRTISLRIEPKERTVRCQEQSAEAEETDPQSSPGGEELLHD